MSRTYVLDTNILLEYSETVFSDLKGDIYIPYFVTSELDNQKSDEKTKGFRARRAIRKISNIFGEKMFSDTVKYDGKNISCVIKESNFDASKLTKDPYKVDDRIIKNCIYLMNDFDDVVLVTNDVSMKIKASILGINTESYGNSIKKESSYKGVLEITQNEENAEKISIAYDVTRNKENIFELSVNQYLIINDGTGRYGILKWDGKKHVDIKNKKRNFSVTPKNALQECALDLLTDDSMPVKIITGGFGTGKSFLATRQLLEELKCGRYEKIMIARNPEGDTDSKDIGFLKGTMDEKLEPFLAPILDNAGFDKYTIDGMMTKGKIEFTIPNFMKGRSLPNTALYVEECEDLTRKTVKLIGSRIAEGSCVIFAGDYKQVESRYRNDNGLLALIDSTVDNELVGYVNLEEDVRSEASKVFINL